MSRKRLAPPQSAPRVSGEVGQAREDFRDGTVKDGVGDREQAHQEQVGAWGDMPAGWDMASQKKPRVKAIANQFGWLVVGHSHDDEGGDPSAKFGFTEQLNRFANAMNFAARAEQTRVQIAQELIDQRRVALGESPPFRARSPERKRPVGAEACWRGFLGR